MSEQGVVTAFVDQVARDMAQKAISGIQGHEDVCSERYREVNATLKTIKGILGWAGTTIFSLLMVTLGWLIVQQVNHNTDDKALLRAQIALLQQQMRPAPAPTTTGPTAR